MNIRLDKYLSDMSVGTRSQIKALAKSGRICVNQQVEKDTGLKINSEKDEVMVDGRIIGYQTYEYYMLNKPAGVVTAVTDNNDRTVMDLMTDVTRKDLFPVGRLDKDTVGLLLITNDGNLAHELLSPKKHVDKTYYVQLDGKLEPDMCDEIRQGVFIEKDRKSKPATLEVLDNTDENTAVHLTIHEGRFHQVKKMFKAVGRTVIYLKRIQFGSLILDNELKEGEYRALTAQEIDSLYQWKQKEK